MLFGKFVNKFYKKYWYLLLFGALFLILVDFFQLEIPEIYGSIIDYLNDNSSYDFSNISNWCLQIAGIGIIMFIGRFAWRNFVFGCGIRVEADLRDDLYSKALNLDQGFYKENKTGGLMAYFTNDLQVIRQCFGEGTILIVDAVFLGILSFYKMFQLSIKLSLIALVPLVIFAFVSVWIEKILKKRFLVRQAAYEKISDFANENFSGISVIKAFVKEKNEKKRFSKLNEENKEVNMNFVKVGVKVDVAFTFVLQTIIAVVLYGCSRLVLSQDSYTIAGTVFSVGNLSEFVSYYNTIIWPMFAISRLINLHAQGAASLKRISGILSKDIIIKDSSEVIKDKEIKGEITFNNLSFNYPDSKIDVLHNINLNINKGETVGIIGKTGCGKTTIVDILLRTYNLHKNELMLDGIDIMKLPIKEVRDAIGYVPQDNFLFSDTITNNISFAYNKTDFNKVVDAAKFSDVHNNIIDFQDQYKTILGERGVTLSGGQKQRVAIARAIIKDPKILILDDSVSAVDTKTEEAILNHLKEVRKGKTTIIIAHRISTVKNLDKIVVLENGKITGIGNHDDLLNSNSEYTELVRLQSLEKKVEEGAINE